MVLKYPQVFGLVNSNYLDLLQEVWKHFCPLACLPWIVTDPARIASYPSTVLCLDLPQKKNPAQSSKTQEKNNILDQSYKWPRVSRGDGSKLSKLSNLCSSSAVWQHTTKRMATQNCEWKQAVFLWRKSLLTVLKGFAGLLYIKCVLLLKKNKQFFQIGPVLFKVLTLKTFLRLHWPFQSWLCSSVGLLEVRAADSNVLKVSFWKSSGQVIAFGRPRT